MKRTDRPIYPFPGATRGHTRESYAAQVRRWQALPTRYEHKFHGSEEDEDPHFWNSSPEPCLESPRVTGQDLDPDWDYQPASGSPGPGGSAPNKDEDRGSQDSDSSEDPLDAYMASLERESVRTSVSDGREEKSKGVREDIETEDDLESYLRYMQENPLAGVVQGDEDDHGVTYDSEGNVVSIERNRVIDPLPPVDHETIEYQPFERNVYVKHEEIEALTTQAVDELRRKLGIRVSGLDPPKPVCSFAHFGFDDALLNVIRKSEYAIPTPIQAQGVPAGLSGRDIIGIAKTGSGKTAAFVWPMLVHIKNQMPLEPGDGPVGVILAPTRELSLQISQEAKKFGKVYDVNVVCAYGGGNMWEQTKACQEGAEIIVATPGRLIDLVKKKITNLQRVTFLVLDEADKMFAMGFEQQVRSIVDHVRPDRQTLLFSATFQRKVEELAREIMADPVRIIQGNPGVANEDVIQVVEVLPSVGSFKKNWLLEHVVQFTSTGSVLIFVSSKTTAEDVAALLKSHDFKFGLLHGDLSQAERNAVFSSFKKQKVPILLATDVAARGLDVPHIRTVVNFDMARDMDTHVHRVGRTGRAGEKGHAYTLVTDKDRDLAPDLVRHLQDSNQSVPQPLLDLTLRWKSFIERQNSWLQQTRSSGVRWKRLSVGGSRAQGVRERPGLGSGNSATLQESASLSCFRAVSGPQTNRLSAMKAAFQEQFHSNFVVALDQRHGTSTLDDQDLPNPSVSQSFRALQPANPSVSQSSPAQQPSNPSVSQSSPAQQPSNPLVPRSSPAKQPSSTDAGGKPQRKKSRWD